MKTVKIYYVDLSQFDDLPEFEPFSNNRNSAGNRPSNQLYKRSNKAKTVTRKGQRLAKKAGQAS